jgi:hypothetical protein
MKAVALPTVRAHGPVQPQPSMSTVSSSTSASGASQAGSPINFQQIKSDFQALSTALQSGDLSGAQQAYASLQKDAPGLFQTASTQNAASTNPLEAALNNIGTALQSGDITAAQQAFSSLQAAQPHRHRHHGHGEDLADASVPSASQDPSTGGSVSSFSAVA